MSYFDDRVIKHRKLVEERPCKCGGTERAYVGDARAMPLLRVECDKCGRFCDEIPQGNCATAMNEFINERLIARKKKMAAFFAANGEGAQPMFTKPKAPTPREELPMCFKYWLELMFIYLKITKQIDWEWHWVLSPLWLPLVVEIAAKWVTLAFDAFGDWRTPERVSAPEPWPRTPAEETK